MVYINIKKEVQENEKTNCNCYEHGCCFGGGGFILRAIKLEMINFYNIKTIMRY